MANLESIVLFILAAISGIALFQFVRKNNRSPIQLVALHAILLFAAHGVHTASVASDVRAYQIGNIQSYPLEAYAFVTFSFALVIGAYMLIKAKVFRKHIEKFAVASYAGLGVLGFCILIVASIAGL